MRSKPTPIHSHLIFMDFSDVSQTNDLCLRRPPINKNPMGHKHSTVTKSGEVYTTDSSKSEQGDKFVRKVDPCSGTSFVPYNPCKHENRVVWTKKAQRKKC